VRGCAGNSGYASNCNGEDRFESFFSGHASLSAGAAALLCKDAIRRGVWGDSRVTQSLICGAGVGAAVGTGMLRIVADKHWMTDVLVGWAVGGLVGWFDLPGPFDLLRFEYDRNGASVEGAWVPLIHPESFGVAMTMRF
jgi:membrane-associated phospholipid phosphatase